MNISPEVIGTETLGQAGFIQSLGSRNLYKVECMGYGPDCYQTMTFAYCYETVAFAGALLRGQRATKLSVGFINITVMNRSENSTSLSTECGVEKVRPNFLSMRVGYVASAVKLVTLC